MVYDFHHSEQDGTATARECGVAREYSTRRKGVAEGDRQPSVYSPLLMRAMDMKTCNEYK